MRKILVLITGIAMLYSCHSSGKKQSTTEEQKDSNSTVTASPPTVKEDFPKGEVISSVKCKSDSTQGYALYLPKEYDKTKPMPAIFLFEPHARGIVPINKYKALADKYHYILLCSNNSQNGMSNEDVDKVVNTYLQDAHARIAIDPKREYVGGFSGGAVVAGNIILNKPGFSGMIGAGRGLPKPNGSIPQAFAYFAIVGDADFNYNEVVMTNKGLEKSPIKPQLEIFEGKHEWPPLEKMDDAIQWMDVQAMIASVKPADKDEISGFIAKHEAEEKTLESSSRNYEAGMEYDEIIQTLNGFQDVKQWQDKLDALRSKDAYKKEIGLLEKLSANEGADRNTYIEAMKSKDPRWWNQQIQSLQAEARNTKGPESAYKKRILALISMMTFMQTDGNIKHKQADAAAHFLEIFHMVDPKNSDVPYLSACVLALKGQKAPALVMLKQAVSYGFDDKNRMLNDEALASLKGDKQFEEIVNKIP